MASVDYTPRVTGTGFKAGVQRFGGYLAGMVMPNIGAFIAWGLITALFIETGWLPNEKLAGLVGPMINFLLPILIGYTGGRMVHAQRGAVIGAVATMGVIVGSAVTADGVTSYTPMFLGAMIAGPLAAWVLKKFDEFTEDRIKPGFEMLVENFSLGIIGGAMAVLGVWGIGPVLRKLTDWAGHGVEYLVTHHVLPFASILIEPCKVLFLNNAINHGVLTPLGAAEAAEKGKSILFMLESNPGPGFGVLLAYLLFGPKRLRPSVPAAMIIQFLGGIHEIYFPYILMKPRLILATICGGAAGILTFIITGAGLVAAPAPGSIFAYIAETPRGVGNFVGVFLGVIISAAVSFFVGSALLGFGRASDPADEVDNGTTVKAEGEDAAAAPELAVHDGHLGSEAAVPNSRTEV